jgi:MoaA/NifB/PqqE/SkfB family radical SAM enzyme
MVEQKQAGHEEIPAKPDCEMLWRMNRRCNFNCVYCFRSVDEDKRTEDPACGKYSAEHIAKRFDETGKVWRIFMTGGEPLLYPGFVELAKALTRGHYISMNTNLSTPNAYELADAVESKRVHTINADIHILEREKSRDGVREYLRKFLHFQERGFNIWLGYVTYPPLFGRIEEDMEWLRGEGVKRINVKVFQGRYRNRRYPRDYSDEERAFIRGLGLNNYEQDILACRVSFLGKKCEAGHRAFEMDTSGNLTRCSTLKDGYGNLFEGTFRPGKSSRRCTVKKCACSYQGMNFTGAGGSIVPPNIIEQPVRFFVAVGEWAGGLSGKILG